MTRRLARTSLGGNLAVAEEESITRLPWVIQRWPRSGSVSDLPQRTSERLHAFHFSSFVDDLQDNAAGVPLRYHALSHEDVMCRLAGVDDVARSEPDAKVVGSASNHWSSPSI